MGDTLGRKQRIKNSDWIEALEKIEQAVSRKELDQLVDKTVKEIKKKQKGKRPLMRGVVERILWFLERSAVWQG